MTYCYTFKIFTIMKKLIKIQGIISQIENLQGLKVDYLSKFNYTSEWTLEIETYCTSQAMGYYMALDGGRGYTVYIENAKIKIIEHMEI